MPMHIPRESRGLKTVTGTRSKEVIVTKVTRRGNLNGRPNYVLHAVDRDYFAISDISYEVPTLTQKLPAILTLTLTHGNRVVAIAR